jgi:hypothetical protein
MAKQEKLPTYACMMPPPNSRKVEHPHDERTAVARRPRRRLLARFVSTLRR